jgi:hypothetical protein
MTKNQLTLQVRNLTRQLNAAHKMLEQQGRIVTFHETLLGTQANKTKNLEANQTVQELLKGKNENNRPN